MQKEDFQQIKANMKARKISGAYIAWQTSRSASNINSILRGEYPYYGAYGLPKYLYEWLVEHKLLEPTQEGYLTQRPASSGLAGGSRQIRWFSRQPLTQTVGRLRPKGSYG